MMKNKKGFLARDWVVGFISAIAVISLCYLMVSGMATKYGKTELIDESFNETYNKYDELADDANEMFEEASSKEGLSVLGTTTLLFSATFTVIQLIFGTLLLPGSMLKRFALDLGAPTLISNIIFTLPLIIITVIIVLVVISSVSQRKL